AGMEVFKVNFCLPEEIRWPTPATRYSGRLEDWDRWLERYCVDNQITDILYYADRLPYHAAAGQVADRLGLRAWVLENGYLRPDWLTFEPFGMSDRSRLPRSQARRQALARQGAGANLSPRFRHSFAEEGFAEVCYGLASAIGRLRYPNYRSDRYYPPIYDYLSWGLRWTQQLATARARRRVSREIEAGALSFTLLALQLQSDYQIRASSPYDHLAEMLEEVIANFARRAPHDRHLIIKGHPLDNGCENWPRVIRRLSRDHGVRHRVHWLDGGDLDALIRRAQGLITVNSTVGIKALLADCPVLALGSAIYDEPGLTHQRGLDRFWTSPDRPDSAHLEQFLGALIAWSQVRGSFYDPEGRAHGIHEIINRLTMVQNCTAGEKTSTHPLASRETVVL
ncbi:MAG: capsular biosynthesis protein, partial [Myxococcota bacterium]